MKINSTFQVFAFVRSCYHSIMEILSRGTSKRFLVFADDPVFVFDRVAPSP